MAVIKKSGFTLVELAVATGIFGILMLVGVNIFFQVVQSANRATISYDIRENASLVMEMISRDVRDAACVSVGTTGYTNDTLYLYSASAGAGCNLNTEIAHYVFGATVKKYSGASQSTITSPNVTFANSNFSTPGSSGPVTINLNVSSAYSSTRFDFSGNIKQTETVSLRQYSF